MHKVAGERSPLDRRRSAAGAHSGCTGKMGCRQSQVRGLTWPLRPTPVGCCRRPADRHARNRAMLAVAYDAMLRRSELASLQVIDMTIDRDGSASLLVRRAKNDPEGAAARCSTSTGTRVKLVLGVARTRAESTRGRLFRSVAQRGHRWARRLDESQVPRIYRAMAERAGLPAPIVQRLSGHSPRVGAAQDMIASGIGIPAIMQAGRWKSASDGATLRRAAPRQAQRRRTARAAPETQMSAEDAPRLYGHKTCPGALPVTIIIES